jgi:hypothetical protein
VQVRSAFRWAFQQYHKNHIKLYELDQLINITDISNNFKLASSCEYIIFRYSYTLFIDVVGPAF